MTRTLAEIDADIAALRAVMGAGAKRVRFADGREAEYISQKEQERALSYLEAERSRAAGAEPVTRVVGRYVSGLSQ